MSYMSGVKCSYFLHESVVNTAHVHYLSIFHYIGFTRIIYLLPSYSFAEGNIKQT